MIYFMQSVEGGPIKIGYSADVDTRRGQLESHYRQPLAILTTLPGGRDEEQAIHERFAHLRLGRTEQFRPALDLMAFIGRPWLVGANPDAVEAMGSTDNREGIILLRGSRAYADWLHAAHKTTHIAKATIFRVAVAEWAERNGLPAPPEI